MYCTLKYLFNKYKGWQAILYKKSCIGDLMAPESKHNRTTKPNHGISHHTRLQHTTFLLYHTNTDHHAMPCHANYHIIQYTPDPILPYTYTAQHIFFYCAIPWQSTPLHTRFKKYQVAVRFLKWVCIFFFSRARLSAEEKAAQPLAGSIFRVKNLGTQGLPGVAFNG